MTPARCLCWRWRRMPAPEAANADPAAAPPIQSDAVLLDAHKQLDVTDAHTCVYRVKYSKRILSYEGKKREAELKVDFNPACQGARLISAATISKDGKRAEISPGEINVMDAGWNASAKRYPGEKILVANLPDVEIGSTIEVEYEITSTNRPYIAGYESFQFPDALDAKLWKLTAPAGVKVQRYLSGPSGSVKEDIKTAGGKQVFSWTADKVAALPSESQLPPEWTYNPGVTFFIGDANDYYRELQQHHAGSRRKEYPGCGDGAAVDRHRHQSSGSGEKPSAISWPHPSGSPGQVSPNSR